jgi:hypothetical protein
MSIRYDVATPRAKKQKWVVSSPTVFVFLGYVITVTVFLQTKVVLTIPKNDSFLTHHHLLGGGADAISAGGATRLRSCSQNAFHSLSYLIRKINEDPTNNAMVPLDVVTVASDNTANDKTEKHSFPGLHLDSFRNKRIALLGDSTLFYMAKYLVSMLLHEERAGESAFHEMKLGEANQLVLSNKQFKLKGTDSPPPYKKENTWFQWFGMQGNSHGRTEQLIDAMFAEAEKMKPEVVVANMG